LSSRKPIEPPPSPSKLSKRLDTASVMALFCAPVASGGAQRPREIMARWNSDLETSPSPSSSQLRKSSMTRAPLDVSASLTCASTERVLFMSTLKDRGIAEFFLLRARCVLGEEPTGATCSRAAPQPSGLPVVGLNAVAFAPATPAPADAAADAATPAAGGEPCLTFGRRSSLSRIMSALR
jgi:hypothetical protein